MKRIPRKVVLTLEAEQAQAKLDAEMEEQNYQERLKKCPPNKKFYTYVLPEDTRYRRLEALPEESLLDELGAERLPAALLGAAVTSFGSAVVTGIYHNSRVVEYEYVYKGKKLYDPRF